MPQPSRYITARITFRRATTKEWENNDPILLAGEPAIDTTANKFKIGDGISPWSSLDYVDGGAGGGGGTFWVNNGNFPEAVTNAAEAIDYLRFWQDTFEDNAAAYFNTGLEGGEFIPLYELNISAGTGGAASIVGEPADFNSYPEGTEVQIQAITFSNYEFSSWSGLLEGEENKALTTITMSGPRVLAAEFVVETPNQAPTVTINGDAIITVYEGGEFTDPGAIYIDDKDGTGVAVASGVVDVNTLGQYTITYTYTDTGGLTSSPKIRVVNVVLPPDVDAPVITLNGDSSIQINEGEDYVEQGATWTDNRDGSGSVTDITGSVGSAVGSYTITYNFTDAAGNSATPVTRTITVLDITLPVITLNGSNSIQLSSGSTYTEEGATWTDNADGSGNVTDITGSVDTGTLGTYTITYSYTDSAGNTGTATRTISVVDTALPTITLNGSNSLEVDEDTTYTELGATWSDNIDGFGAVTDITTDLDITTPGTYTVRYNYTDTSGNKATEVVRTITVLEVDVTPASVSVLGDNPTTLVVGQSYTDYGAVWFDNFDGSGMIPTGTGSVDVNTEGTYTITYSYTDAAGNEASATRTVNVVVNNPMYVYSEPDGGFYYPLYRYSFGLSDYHEHVLGGVTYYMLNSDMLGVENEDWAHGHHLYPSSSLGLDAGTSPPTDSDNDGTPDDFDYWPTSLHISITLEELDTYLADPLKIINALDVVKILVTNEIGDAGDYVYLEAIYSNPLKYRFVRSDGTTYEGDDALASNRGTLWEVYTDPSLPRSADLSSFSEWNVADPSTTESSTATIKGLASGAEMTHVVYTLENGVFSFNGTDQSVTTGTFQSGETIQLIDPSNPQFEGFYELSEVTTYTYNGGQQPKLTLATLQKPVIILNGDSSIELNIGETYTEAGATWSDNYDGTGAVTDISYPAGDPNREAVAGDTIISKSDNTILATSIFNYGGSWASSGSTGFPTGETAVIIEVIPPPSSGAAMYKVDYNGLTRYISEAYRFSYNYIELVSSGLDTSISGNYTVTYNYTDSDGNSADSVSRTVVVLADTTAPVISITGSEITYVNLNGTYTEQGATWTDGVDGSGSVTDITGTVDTSTEGQYTLTYRHTDAAGNVGTKSRYVRVVQEDETTYFPGINASLGKWQITEQLVISEEESTLMTTTTARPEVGDVIRYTGANAHGYVQNQLYVVIGWVRNSSAIGSYYWEIADRFGYTMPVTLMGSRDGNHQPTPGEPRTFFIKAVLADYTADTDGDGLTQVDGDYFFGLQSVAYSEAQLEALPVATISSGSADNIVAKYTGENNSNYFQGSWYYITRQRWNYLTNQFEYETQNRAGLAQSVNLLGSSTGPTNTSNPLTNWDPRQLSPDTDGDFIRDDVDYFYTNPSYTLTKQDLDAMVEDRDSAIEVGDIVKIIHRHLGSQENGEYYIVTGTGSQTGQTTWNLQAGGNFYYSTTYVYPGDRGATFEKVVASTAPADDLDGDTVLNNDEYFQYNSSQTVALQVLQTNYAADIINPVTKGALVVVTSTTYITNAAHGEYLIYKGSGVAGHVFEKGNGEYAVIDISANTNATIEYYRASGPSPAGSLPTFNLLEFMDNDYDYDGVDNTDEYFVRNAAWTVTQNDLDTLYTDDATRPYLLVGDLVQVKNTASLYGSNPPAVGDYMIYKGVSTAWPYPHQFEKGSGAIYEERTSYINGYLPGNYNYSFMIQTTRDPLADDDADYVDNDQDYFYGISDLHYTQAELDRFSNGIKPTPIVVGDVIKYRFNSGLVYGFPNLSYWKVASITPWADTGQYLYELIGRDGTTHPQTLIGSLYGPGNDGSYNPPTRPRNIYAWETDFFWVDLEDVPQTIEYRDFNTLTFNELTAYKGEMKDNGWSGDFVLTSQGYRLRTGGPMNWYAARTLTVTPGLRYRIEADLGTNTGQPIISVGTSVRGSEITYLNPTQGANTLDFTTNESSVIITFHDDLSGSYVDYNSLRLRTLPYPETYFGYSKWDLDTIMGSISGGGLPIAGTIIKGILPNSEPIIDGEYYRVTGEIPGVGWTCEDAYGSSTYWTGQPYEIYPDEQGTTWIIPNLDHLP
jgi:hypothetical protein